MHFLGIDGEMSAASVAAGGRLIQIGVVVHANKSGEESQYPAHFGSLVNPGEYHWDARAAAVHGFRREEIDSAPASTIVDDECVAWLAEQGVRRPRSAIAVGFNVGSFDLPHIAIVLPKTYLMLSRRTVDLNALCFTLEGKQYQGSTPSWSGWKRMATTYAERTIHERSLYPGLAHDAEYDALLHLFAWRFLRAAIHGNQLAMPQEPVHDLGKVTQRLTGELVSRIGMEAASQHTGFTREQLQGWVNGGRPPGPQIADRLQSCLASLPE